MWPTYKNRILTVLPNNFAYVILTAVASAFMVFYLAERVAFARKAHKVKYPTFYSPDNQLFNCSQLAHGNTLENYPQFLMFLFIAGIGFPEASSVLGVIWVVGHLSHAHGYFTGAKQSHTQLPYQVSSNPPIVVCDKRPASENETTGAIYLGKRMWGVYDIGMLGLIGLSVTNAFRLLQLN